LNYEGRRPSSLDKHKADIIKYIETESVSKLSQLQKFIEKEYSLTIEHSWLSRYCKKNSIRLTKKQG
jgi:transposase